MKANELRICNWFNEFGMPTQADGRFIDRLQNIELRNKIAIDITPIPLTPEILEKAGFVNKDLGNLSYNLAYGDGVCISISFNGTWICYLTYLHQLQNLYFALTGEELNISL